MTRRVTFGLGNAVNLSNRLLTITRMYRAGDDSAPTPEVVDVLAGTATSSTQTLSENTMFQATLVDTSTGGVESDPEVLNFHTGDLLFPGRSKGRLSIMQIEDMSSSSSSSLSSSSSSSSSSISTSSSSSSASSISSQSTSSSSISSQSTSSSSISSQSTSSSSASSISTSSSSSSASSESSSSSSSSSVSSSSSST